jgi:alkylation response protein AidB-like acyl-CoA dehydrogenase
MSLVLTEDQQMLARTASAFITEHSKVARLRKLRDSRDERGYSLDVYKKMAELGWTAIAFSEADGGLGMGLSELVIVTEAMGRALTPEPLIPAIALAGQALAQGGTAAQKEAWLAPAIAGEKVLAFAYAEARSRFDLANVTARAEAQGAGGYRLNGEKTAVWGGHCADAYLVAARTSGADGDAAGITLFLVPATTKGVTSERQYRVDSLNASIVRFANVEISAGAVVGKVGDGHALLANAVDRATVALCGEMLGGMSEAFDRTVTYLKERKQFGAPIGSFQALKHRAARIYIELELSRSAVMAAARAFDSGLADAPQLASLAKARISDTYCLVVNEAVQMHGGIGMTDEHEIGFFMKRARASEMTFGDAAHHRDRFASLGGY